MSALRFIIFLAVAKYCHAQACAGKTPFLMPDKSCASFTEVCIKKEFKPCATLLDACEQCPPSNYTILTLMDIINMIKIQSNSTETSLKSHVAALQAQSSAQQANFTRIFESKCGGSSIIIIILLILVLFIVVAVLMMSAFICLRRKFFQFSDRAVRYTHAGGPDPQININEPADQENAALVQNRRYSDEPGPSGRQPGGGSTNVLNADENDTINELRKENAYLIEVNKELHNNNHQLEKESQDSELQLEGLRAKITENQVHIESLKKQLEQKERELKDMKNDNKSLTDLNNQYVKKIKNQEKEICDMRMNMLASDQDRCAPAMTAESKNAYPDWWKTHMPKT